MNLPTLSRQPATFKIPAFLAVYACLASPQAGSQTLSPSTPVMLNQSCPTCSVLSANLHVDPAGNVFADWKSQEMTGQRQVSTRVARFSVLAGKWGASPIGLPLDADSDVQIGYDRRGNALATWSVFFEGNSELYYSHYSTQQRSWSRGVKFWDPRESADVTLTVGPSGDAIIEGSARGGQPLFHFDPATRTIRERGSGAIKTAVSADERGNAIHLSVDRAWSAPVPQHVYAMKYDASLKRWLGREKLDPDFERSDGLNTDHPRVVMDRNGNGMGLWAYMDDVNGVPYRMGSVRYLARTGQFRVKSIPVTGNGPVYGASMATDSASNVYAVWSQKMNGKASTIVFARYSSATGTWSRPRVIQTGTGLAWNPRIAADKQGNVIAAWIEQNGAGRYVQTAARYSTTANTWGKPVTVQRNTEVSSYGTRLAMDDNRRATVIWLQEELPTVHGNPSFKLMASRLSF